jgi:hypothetical protein
MKANPKLATSLASATSALLRAQGLVQSAENRETLEKCRIAVMLVAADECPDKEANKGHHGG